MDGIELSIIIPVYNVEDYIKECIESVLKQINDRVQVIIVNDGSTDNSINICNNVIENNPNVTIIEQKNSGLSAARNTGIKRASGKYLLFLDSDDYLADGCMQKLLSIIETCDSDFIFGKASRFNENDLLNIPFPCDYNFNTNMRPADIFYKLNQDKKFWFAAWLVITKRDFLIKNSLYFKEGIYHEDELWVPQIFVMANDLYLWDCEFYCYRVNRKNSIINSENIKKVFDRIIVINELSELLKRCNDKDKKCIIDRNASLVWGVILQTIQYYDNVEYEKLLNQIKKQIKYLRYKKYWMVYFAVKILGIKQVVNILRYLQKKNKLCKVMNVKRWL